MRKYLVLSALLLTAPLPVWGQASPVISSISNTGILTLPTSTDTLVGRDTIDTLTNKTLVAPVLGAATGTSIALGGASIGSDALAITGSATFSGADVAASFQPTSATIPNNGMYLKGANNIGFSSNGVVKMDVSTVAVTLAVSLAMGSQTITGAGTITANNSSGPRFDNSVASSTNPTLIPNRASVTTGLGAQASGNASMVAGGTEIERWTSTGPLIVTLPTDAAQTDNNLCINLTSHIIYTGSGTLGACLGTSSSRYKHGIVDLAPGLPELMALRPVSYFLNADHGDPNKQLYGFIAEEVIKVLPKLVGRDSKGRPDTADYLGMVPVLVKAIQQQQAEIRSMRKEVSLLRAGVHR